MNATSLIPLDTILTEILMVLDVLFGLKLGPWLAHELMVC